MSKYFSILILLFVNFSLHSQIVTTIFPDGDAFKEFPMLNQISKEEITIYEMPEFNLDSVFQEEKKLDEKGVGRPFRFGYSFDVDYGIEHGKWFEVEDKRIWSIRFKSKNAYTLNFRLFNLKLGNNSELYVYNSEGTVVYGPVTHKENSTEEFNSIGTDLIACEEAIIQIIEPKTSMQNSSTKITKVVHGFKNHYKDILPNDDKIYNNFQGVNLDCYIDVTCPPYGPIFENESKGVVRILTYDDDAFCSGSLLNNQLGTNRPFILTAFHCGDDDKDGTLDISEKIITGSWNFQFGYKKTTCNGNTTITCTTYSNAHFRAAWYDTDFLLLELKNAVADPNIRFLGWDALPAIPPGPYPLPPFASPITMGVCLHHPGGDPMKISVDNSVVDLNSFPIYIGSKWYPGNTHYDVYFDYSTVENGSSGAPLFDHNKRIRGQLHGGVNIGCAINVKYFGALEASMSGGETDETSLMHWLVLYPTGSYNVLQTNTIGPCQNTILRIEQ